MKKNIQKDQKVENIKKNQIKKKKIGKFPKYLDPIIENKNEWNDYIPVDVYDEERFFNELHKESFNYHMRITQEKLKKRKNERNRIF